MPDADPATTLAAHRWLATSGACACGDPTVCIPEWPAHVLAMLARKGLTIVGLPEPGLTRLTVTTRRPTDYRLVDIGTSQVWAATNAGTWERGSLPADGCDL